MPSRLPNTFVTVSWCVRGVRLTVLELFGTFWNFPAPPANLVTCPARVFVRCSFDCLSSVLSGVRVTVCGVFVCNGVRLGDLMLVMRGWSLQCPTTPGSEGTLHWLLPQSISRPCIGCFSVASAQTSPAVADWLSLVSLVARNARLSCAVHQRLPRPALGHHGCNIV